MVMDGENKPTGDALPEGGQPSSSGKSPSAPTERTYSEVEIAARHSKLDKTIAQLTRERDEYKVTADSKESELEKLQKRIDDAELEGLGENAELKSLYQQKREARKEKAEAQAEKREAARLLAEAKAEAAALTLDKAEIAINKLATKYKLPVNTLSDLGITDLEALEKVAATLAANMAVKPKEGEGGFKEEVGLSSGGAGEPTPEQLEKMTPKEYAEWASKRFK